MPALEVHIELEPGAKERFLADIEEIQIRLIELAREQERVIANAASLREIAGGE